MPVRLSVRHTCKSGLNNPKYRSAFAPYTIHTKQRDVIIVTKQNTAL